MTARLRYKGEIRDPIHGLIAVTATEFELINTPVFQRLRRIKQLALAELGFHGATHNRFGHSVGVMHVVSRMADHLGRAKDGAVNWKDREFENIRIAALLHDLGHGPFSHVSEYLLKEFLGESKAKVKTEEIHESITQSVIRTDKEITRILGKDRASQVADLLATDGKEQDFQHDLVSGPLDGDKMDYLLRDSYYAGVRYGHFDLERLINVLTVVDENKKKRLAVGSEGIQTVEQYVLAKYFIASQVYQHKIRHVTDRMIIDGIKRSIEEGNRELKRLYSFSPGRAYAQNYMSWNDGRVFESVRQNGRNSSLSRQCFRMLENRVLPKEIVCCKLTEISPANTLEATTRLKQVQDEDCKELINCISRDCKLVPAFTHVMVYSLKSPLIQKSFGIVDEESIRVRINKGSTSVLDQESSLYRGIVETASNYYIQVIGLPKSPLTSSNKAKNEKKVRRILKNYFEGLI